MINYHVSTINAIYYKLHRKSIALPIVELSTINAIYHRKSILYYILLYIIYISIYSEHLQKSVTYVKHNFGDNIC